MANFVEKYLNYKEINDLMTFFKKKSVNWLCLINNDFNKNCSGHKFFIDVEGLLEIETDGKKSRLIFKIC